MPQADGTILIDTEINADGMKAGSEEIEASVKKCVTQVDRMTLAIKNSNKEAMEFIDNYVAQMGKAEKSNNEFKKSVSEAEKEISELEGKGLYFGDEEYDNAFLKLQKVTQALKDYKKELLNPAPSKNPFDTNTIEGQLKQAKLNLQKLYRSGKGLGTPEYDNQLKKVAELTESYKKYKSEVSKTDSQIQAEADKQAATKAKEEAKINSLNQKLEETRAKEVQAIIEADRLKAIGNSAEISRQDIVDLNTELKKLKARQTELEKAGLGLGFEEFDENTRRIAQISNQLREYQASLSKTDSAQKKASDSGNKLSKSLKNTGKSANSASFGIGKMLGTSILFSFVFQAISGVMNAMKEGFTNLAQYSGTTNNSISMLWSSLERLKNSLATAFAPILNVVAPILSKFIDMLSTAASYVSMFFSFLSGKNTYTRAVAVQKDYAASLEDTAASAQDAAKATDEAAEAAERYLSPLDDINRYTDNSKTSGSTPSYGGNGNGLGTGGGPLFEETPIDNKFTSLLDSVLDKLKQIRDIFMDGFWDGLGDYKPVLKDLKKDLKSIGKSIKKIFSDADVQKSAKQFAKSFIYALGQVVGSFASIGLTIARNIIGGMEKYLSQNTKRIQKYIIRIFDVGSDIAKLVGNFSASFADVISDVFGSETAQQITGNIIGIFSEVGMLVSELAASLMDDLINVIVTPFIENKERITQALLGTLEAIEPVTTGMLTAIQTVADSVMNLYDEYIKPFFDSITSGLSSIIERILEGYNTYILPILQNLGNKFQELMEGPFAQMVSSVEGFLGRLINALKILWEQVLVPILTWLSEKFFPVIAPAVEAIGDVAISTIKLIINAVKNIMDILSGVIDFIVGVFTGDWQLAWEGIKNIFSAAWSLIKSVLSTVWESIKKIISSGLEVVKNLVNEVWSGIKNTTTNIWNSLKNSLSDILDRISDKFKTVWNTLANWVPNKIQTIRNAIVNKFINARDTVVKVFEGIVNSVKSVINRAIKIVNGAINKINGVIGGIENAFSFSYDFTNPFTGTRYYGSYGLDLPRVNNIPYLASGAVIPPNKEFMAVLGDQRHGTNIEAPESLIRRIVREETSNNGGVYQFVAQLNGKTIFKEVIDQGKMKRIQTGKNEFELT